MELKMQDKLKQDLKRAVKEKDYAKIEQLKKILNIPEEQYSYFEKGLTGFPSVDKVWLKYYAEGAEEKANNIPENQTVWDYLEKKLEGYGDIPVIEYFGRKIYNDEFIENSYKWAKVFKAMGVQPGEVVPYYGPSFPEVDAMNFGLNMIGAVPYHLKLAISPEALEKETKDSRIAIVFDEMWPNVSCEFSKDRFKNVIVVNSSMDMPSPTKEIVSFKGKIEALKNKSRIPNTKKYVWADVIKEIADYYLGPVKVPFEANRAAFITSSSGTTVGGIVKGTVATNESTISQLQMGDNSGIQYFRGDRCLNNFPYTASTSLNVLNFLAMLRQMTIIMDPRVSEKDFYNQMINLKPNVALITGSYWEAFFNRVIREIKQGKKFDFSHARGWTVGGEGSDCEKFIMWNEIMKVCNAFNLLFSGYGSSELFSATCVEAVNARYDYSKKIMSVGIPYAGITMGVFDENGNELSYNQRGELYIKSKSAMKEYYNNPELTAKTKVDGWIKTGDLAEINEDGFIFIWGRVKDCIIVNDNKLYLFDVANKVKENPFIDDCIVLSMPTKDNDNNLVAHIVWKDDVTNEQKTEYIELMNNQLNEFLPDGVCVSGYCEHDTMLPYSPTTIKKDKNKMSKTTTGYVQVIDGKMNKIEFILNEDGKYSQKCAIMKENKIKLFTFHKKVA